MTVLYNEHSSPPRQSQTRDTILKPNAHRVENTPNPEGTTIAPCPGCGKDIPTRNYIRVLNDDGTYGRVVESVTRCDACEAKHKKLVAESKVREAEAKARYEKSLADLLNSIPKKTERQIGFDMGLD